MAARKKTAGGVKRKTTSRAKKEVSSTKKMSPVQPVVRRKTPVHAEIVSILYYIAAGFSAIAGLLVLIFGILFLAGGAAALAGTDAYIVGGALAIIGPFFIILGLIVMGLAVLLFFVAKGLYRGKNWARIVALVISILGFFGAIGSIIQGEFFSIISLLFNGYISWVLLFVTEVKQFFR